ncbi:hypothetical protein ASG81_01835 [Paenibacillus sp. Soil522]|nr:hypothetical protein ASG81_01835 [Paenibacillus sp. Soil522]
MQIGICSLLNNAFVTMITIVHVLLLFKSDASLAVYMREWPATAAAVKTDWLYLPYGRQIGEVPIGAVVIRNNF